MQTERVDHRGQINGKGAENSFESFRDWHKYEGDNIKDHYTEYDVMLLSDGTLGIIHPAGFARPDGSKFSEAELEALDLQGLEELRIRRPEDPAGEATGGLVPLFQEFIGSNFDRGLKLMIEVKGSSPEQARKAMRATIEKMMEMKKAGAFKNLVDPEKRDPTEAENYFQESIFLATFSPDAIDEANQVFEETGERIPTSLIWSGSPKWAIRTPLSVRLMSPEFLRGQQATDSKVTEAMITESETAFVPYSQLQPGESWEQHGLKVAQELKCERLNYLPDNTVTPELVAQVHAAGIKLDMGKFPDAAAARPYGDMGVDAVSY